MKLKCLFLKPGKYKSSFILYGAYVYRSFGD